jgi:hypothetical protein
MILTILGWLAAFGVLQAICAGLSAPKPRGPVCHPPSRKGMTDDEVRAEQWNS